MQRFISAFPAIKHNLIAASVLKANILTLCAFQHRRVVKYRKYIGIEVDFE